MAADGGILGLVLGAEVAAPIEGGADDAGGHDNEV